MPIYVYRCSNCDHEFEHNQKFSDPHLKRCPECGKMTLNKVFTPATVIYKGSGFYSTDHRSRSGSAPTTPHKKTEDKGDNKGSEKKTETTTSETTKPKEVSSTKKEE
jgi:putative FmdB family regulatory protein